MPKINIREIDRKLTQVEGGAVNLPIAQVAEVRHKFSLMLADWTVEEIGQYLAQVKVNDAKNRARRKIATIRSVGR